ncbi:ATP-binding cassette domain-containing protein [Paracoccus niistensis]|uniref:Glutathione import ATP-binding protein GsiA n=1 Tax=Paracoccus niistensis TaxID=632935 RepID=A0ABV6HZL6_9RHOB
MSAAPDPAGAPILKVEDLHVRFPVSGGLLGRKRILHAVSGVDLSVQPGQCLSLVGESGCGKSTTALAIMGLQPPSSGAITVEGRPVYGPGAPDRRARARLAQIVFQDPFSTLNPRETVGRALSQPLMLHGVRSRAERAERVATALRQVGLLPEHAARYPHEFSGGQRQRIGIARALILGPRLIVLDEPVSALDVSIRAQIINLLMDLQQNLGLSYLMISHDLGVVEHVSDRVAVMFAGQIVEEGGWREVFTAPAHPYTRRLIETIPNPARLTGGASEILPPAPEPPSGSVFWPPVDRRPDISQPPEPSVLMSIGEDHRVRVRKI